MLLLKKVALLLEEINRNKVNLKKRNILFFNSLIEYLNILREALEINIKIANVKKDFLISKINSLQDYDDTEEEVDTPPVVIDGDLNTLEASIDEILRLMIETHAAIISDRLKNNLLRILKDVSNLDFIINSFYKHTIENTIVSNNKVNFLPPNITSSDSITDKVDDAIIQRISPPKPLGSLGSPQQTLFLDSSGKFYDPAYVATCEWLRFCDYNLGFASLDSLSNIICLIYDANNTLMQDMSTFAAKMQEISKTKSTLKI